MVVLKGKNNFDQIACLLGDYIIRFRIRSFEISILITCKSKQSIQLQERVFFWQIYRGEYDLYLNQVKFVDNKFRLDRDLSMTQRLKIDFDQAYIEELERIRPRVGMFIGSHSLSDLMTYMNGYMSALNNFATQTETHYGLRWFGQWIIERFGYYGNNAGFNYLIEEEAHNKEDEDEKLNLFYAYLDEFKTKKWGHLLATVTLNDTNIPIQDWKGTNPRWEDEELKMDVFPTPKKIELTYSLNCFSVGYYTYDESGKKSFERFGYTFDQLFNSINKLFQIQPEQWELTEGSFPTWSEAETLDAVESDSLVIKTQGLIALVNNSKNDELVEHILLSIVENRVDTELTRVALYGLMRRIMYRREWTNQERAFSVLSSISNDSSKAILRLKNNLLENIEKQQRAN